jgi:hypothetical protein
MYHTHLSSPGSTRRKGEGTGQGDAMVEGSVRKVIRTERDWQGERVIIIAAAAVFVAAIWIYLQEPPTT